MNPFQSHVNKLFSDRDTIELAMEYATILIDSISDGQDKVTALTAMMVLVNTAAKVWPEPEAPAPAPVAPDLAQVRADLDARLASLASRVGTLEQALGSTARVGWTRDELVALTRDEVSDWADQHFNDRADEWLHGHADLDDKIENWVENNLDIEDEVKDVLRDADLKIRF